MNVENATLNIQEHNFLEAKNALRKYSDQGHGLPTTLTTVKETVLLPCFDHDVTGKEFNEFVKQVQSNLVSNRKLIMGIVDEFGQVYKAFEALDKDYIAGIVASIKAAEEVSKEEQKDRAHIKELVDSHEKAVQVLKRFKDDIDKVRHIADVDTIYPLVMAKINAEASLSTRTLIALVLSGVGLLLSVCSLMLNLFK